MYKWKNNIIITLAHYFEDNSLYVTKAFRKYCAQNHQHFIKVLFGLVC